MDIKNIFIKDYLESLTERAELNYIFPILLESMSFEILTKPSENIGLKEYGKDIVAVGKDIDGVRKKFYFELKGGKDRDITESNFYGKDGIQDSITQASYNKFLSTYPKFDDLPLRIIIVHNGIIKGSVQDTLEPFLISVGATLTNTTFDRWDISRLTSLFSEHLFGAYLLTDKFTSKLFNSVIVNLNAHEGIHHDYKELLDKLFNKQEWTGKFNRKWQLLFESIKLISFIIYTESKEYNNFEIAKRYLTYLVLRFWYWILKNELESNKKIIKYFTQAFFFYFDVLREYFSRIQPIVTINDGLYFENAGRYEQIGYTTRTFEFLQYFCFALKVENHLVKNPSANNVAKTLIKVMNCNSVSARPLIDIHSIPIIDIINLLIEGNEIDNAKTYLNEVMEYIKFGKENHKRLPDAANNIENVIKYIVTREKPIYYQDTTSPLLSVLLEYTVILDMQDEYNELRDFIIKHEIDLGIFVPHHGINSISKHLIEDLENDLEEQMFSRSVNDGYQSGTMLRQLNNINLSFEDYKIKIEGRKNEFNYKYRTDIAGFPYLKDLAHIFFRTPYFPDKWRSFLNQ
jgi:hypothetical protein